jgi:hypothetical protein
LKACQSYLAIRFFRGQSDQSVFCSPCSAPSGDQVHRVKDVNFPL